MSLLKVYCVHYKAYKNEADNRQPRFYGKNSRVVSDAMKNPTKSAIKAATTV